MSTVVTNTIETSTGGPVTLTKQHAAKAWINLSGSSLTDPADEDGRLCVETGFEETADTTTDCVEDIVLVVTD